MAVRERNQLWLLPVIYYLSFLLILVLYWFAFAIDSDWHREWLQGEDKLGELLTFAAFFSAFAAFIFILKRFWRDMKPLARVYFIGVAAFFFVCAGEEISWAQRAIGFSTPQGILDANEQDEFNLHNLHFENIHPQFIATLCLELFGILVPLLGFWWTFGPEGWLRRYVAPFYMVPCFLFADSLNTIQRSLKPWLQGKFGNDIFAIVRSDTRELSEMIWGLCAMLSAFSIYAAWRRFTRPEKRP